MIAIKGKRDILVGLLSGHLSLSRDGQFIDDLRQLPSAEVTAVFFGDNSHQLIPDLLVVDTPNLQEFFAWCSTYLPQWSPLSAGMHIVEKRRLRDRLESARGELPRQLLRGLLCVALGELFFEWQVTNGQTLPNILSIRSTFGYAATCAVMANRACLNDLLSSWSRAQHLLQLTPRRLNSNILKNVWSPLFSLVKPTLEIDQPSIVAAEFADIIAREHQHTLFRFRPLSENAPRRREQIVVELEKHIQDSKLADSPACFEAAMISSRMSTSPMSHFDVLSEMASAEPRTLLWYSFLSGMFASEPAIPRIESMLFRLESDQRNQPNPKPDILLDELEAMIGSQGQIPSGIGIGARFINVELDYGVCASFRLRHDPPQLHSEVSRVDDRQLFNELLGQLRDIFERNAQSEKDRKGRSIRKRARRRRS